METLVRRLTLALLLLIPSGLPARAGTSAPPPSPIVSWYGPGGGPTWGLGSSAEMPLAGASSRPIARWFPRLPDRTIELLDGSTLDLAATRGEILVISYWATWCGPCGAELPYLERLREETAERGVSFVAINVRESPQQAIAWTEDLGLTLPIGRYDPELAAALFSERLPTTVVVDREGRIRGRWEAFEPEAEDNPAATVRALLAEREPPAIDGPEVRPGSAPLEPRWWRELDGKVDGLSPVEGGFLASGPARLDRFRDDGVLVSRTTMPRDPGRLRPDGGGAALAYRPGSRLVARVQPGKTRPDGWELPSPVFDVEPLPGGGEHGAALVGTLGGLTRLDLSSGDVETIGSFREVSGVVATSGTTGPGVAWALLEAGRRVVRLDASFEPVDVLVTDPSSWSLIDGGDSGFGVATDRVVAAAVGRFLPGRGPLLAFAERDGGRLRVVDPADGSTIYEARWDGITDLLAIGDGGDGIDALVVAREDGVALFSASGSAHDR